MSTTCPGTYARQCGLSRSMTPPGVYVAQPLTVSTVVEERKRRAPWKWCLLRNAFINEPFGVATFAILRKSRSTEAPGDATQSTLHCCIRMMFGTQLQGIGMKELHTSYEHEYDSWHSHSLGRSLAEKPNRASTRVIARSRKSDRTSTQPLLVGFSKNIPSALVQTSSRPTCGSFRTLAL